MKKNLLNTLSFLRGGPRQIKKRWGQQFFFRLMRITVTQALLISITMGISIAGDGFSQEVLDRKVSLELTSSSLKEALTVLERQAKVKFVYSASALELTGQVTLNVSNQKLSDVLDWLLEPRSIAYVVKNKIHIVLKPAKDNEGKATLENAENRDGQTDRVEVIRDIRVQHLVTGKVTDGESGEPIPGVNILIKGTTQGTTTNAGGEYTIEVPDESSILVFSSIGFEVREIVVGNSSEIDVILSPHVTTLQEVIVTGYMTQRKVDLTGAVSVVDLENVRDIPSANTMQMLQGRVPGLYVTTTGSPSGETTSVLIRGMNTLGNNDPLYVIDGVPTKRPDVLQDMDPSTVESIQVLKDASAASIYGARASNGVIVITTKKGQQGLDIDFKYSVGVQNYSLLNKVDMLNTVERGEILWQAAINDGTDPAVHSALYSYDWQVDGLGNPVLNEVTPVEWVGGDPAQLTKAQVPGTDWQDVAYRNSLMSNASLTISGGGENTSALLGFGYLKNEGIMEYTDYQRLSVRVNTSHSFFDGKLKIGEDLLVAKTIETPTGGDLGGVFVPLGIRNSGGNMHSLAVTLQPILPVYREDGSWAGPIGSGFSDRNNVLHMLYIHKDNKKTEATAFGSLYGELKLMDNLVFRSNFGLEYVDSYGWWFEEEYTEGFLRRSINNLTVLQERQLNWTWSNTLNYNLISGHHSLGVLAGMEAIRQDYTSLGAYREGFAIQDVEYRYIDAGTGTQTSKGSGSGHRLVSYFGKFNYAFQERYLASLTLRYDGSSRFGSQNRFGLFPAITAGWRINNEDFFEVPFISNLKLRGGVGRVGNQEIGDTAPYGLYAPNYGAQEEGGNRNVGTAYDINGAGTGTLPSGFVAVQTENQNLKWESTDELNVGIDFGLFEDMITGSFDIFTRETTGILISPPYAGVVGAGGNRWENGATVENSWFEFALGYRKLAGDFFYALSGQISSFQDKITYLPESVVRSYPGNVEKTILGHSQSSYFGYKTDGIFQTTEEVAAHAIQPGKGVGRIRFADLNSDGIIDPLDQDWLGTSLPDFEYGVNGELGYKNFTFSFYVQGVSGRTVNNSQKGMLTMTHAQSGMNYGKATFQGWTPTNTDTDIPAQSLVNSNNETRASDYFRTNGSYFKMRTAQLSYSMPTRFTEKLGLDQFRIYFLAENFFLLKDKKGRDRFFGPDPETPNYQYPRPTTLTLGLNISM